MCGIAGAFVYRAQGCRVDQAGLVRAQKRMSKRGPDDSGLWIRPDGRVALAHQRLSIIDLSVGARQPLWDCSGVVAISFNGEIYNYRELKEDLEKRGHVFNTASDTEVLLASYKQFGTDMFRHLRGMYAFALWDSTQDILVLARDEFGIKPLYYSDDGQCVTFASQVKALLEFCGQVTPSPAGNVGYLMWGFVPEPHTVFNEIKSVPAGTALVFQHDRSQRQIRHYCLRSEILGWEERGMSDLSLGAAREVFAGAIDDSIRAHFVADVPVGVFLSAGMDSTTLVSRASRLNKYPIETITLGFEEYRGTDHDETALARKTAEILGTNHHEEWVSRADFDAADDTILEAMDQPSCDGINTYFVSKAANLAGLKVAISGVGADEIFGSYPSFRQVPRLAAAIAGLPLIDRFGSALTTALWPLRRLGVSPKILSIPRYGASIPGAYYLKRGLFMPPEVGERLPAEFVAEGLRELATESALGNAVKGIESASLQVSMLEFDFYLKSQLLRDTDWASMAHSIEVRVPFLDKAFLREIGPLLARRVRIEKRDLFAEPDSKHFAQLSNRPKTGFTVPISKWGSRKRNLAIGPGRARPWALRIFQREFSALPVLALLTDGYGGRGGIAKFNRDLLEAISTFPRVQAVHSYPRTTIDPPEGVPRNVIWWDQASRSKTHFLRQSLIGAIRSRPQLIICGHINLVPWAAILGYIARAPVVLVIHGIDAWAKHRNVFVRAMLGAMNHVIAVSSFTADNFKNWSHISCPVWILPNCVDLTKFSPKGDTNEIRAKLDIQGGPILLTVCRLAGRERYKGFDEVLDVMPELVRRNPQLTYVIAGEGEDRARLEAKARELSIEHRVRFTGYVDEADKAALYRAADVFVMPSRGEGFGIVFLEALACGAPVIGSLLDGSKDALLNGELGQLIDPSRPQDLTLAIDKALSAGRVVPERLSYFSKDAFNSRVHRILRAISETQAG